MLGAVQKRAPGVPSTFVRRPCPADLPAVPEPHSNSFLGASIFESLREVKQNDTIWGRSPALKQVCLTSWVWSSPAPWQLPGQTQPNFNAADLVSCHLSCVYGPVPLYGQPIPFNLQPAVRHSSPVALEKTSGVGGRQ